MSYFNKYSYFHRGEPVQHSSTSSNPSMMQSQYTHQNQKNITGLPAGSILLYNITPEEFFEKIKGFVKEALQQDQLLTKQGAMKMAGVSTAKFKKAIEDGIIVPQLIKGRTTAMYLESQVVKIVKKKVEGA